MNPKKYVALSALVAVIILTILFNLGDITSKEITQYIPSISSQSQTAAVADFNSSLIAHYTFDDTTNDSAGSNNGTAVGGPTYTAGKVGRAIQLDGGDDKVSFNAFNVPSSFTISTWISPGSSQSRDWSQILGEVNTGSGLHFKRGANKISYYFSGSDHLTNGSLNTDQWNHVVLVQNSGNYTFYINGNLDASGTGGVSFSPYIIGHNQWGETFAGLIDDMRVYNRPLDAGEISQLYNLGSGGSVQVPPTPDPTPTPTPTPTPDSTPTPTPTPQPAPVPDPVVVTPPPTPSNGTSWYVDKDAPCTTTCDGTSWARAWKSFASINWNTISAGHTLYISGGNYNEVLRIVARGTANAPITIKVGQDAGHNDKVIISTYLSAVSTEYLVIDGEYQGQRNLVVNGVGVCRDCGAFDISQSTAPKVRYVEIKTAGIGLAFTNGRGGEFSYNYIHDIRGDAGMRLNGTNGTTPNWDQTLVHDNTIQLNSAMTGDGAGPDGIQGAFGLSVYNNHIYNAQGPLSPDGTNHSDLIQGQAGYVKIYNNLFENITDSTIDFDGQLNGDSGHGRIFNNVIKMTYTAGQPSGIRIYSTNGAIRRFVDIHIYNNTFVDQAMASLGGYPFSLGYNGGNPTLSDVHIKNNIFYNTGKAGARAVINIDPSTGFTQSDWDINYNLVHAGAQGATDLRVDGVWGFVQQNGVTTAPTFVSYSQGSVNNNLRLSSADTSAQNKGANLSSLCSLSGFSELCRDKDGNLRPSSGAWDIGAYENSGGTPTPPPVTPPTSPLSTYYVSPSGNDSNAGTSASPFRTIQKAANIVIPGDTVIVRNGTYTDTDGNNIIATIGRGGSAGAPVTFRSENPSGAVLSGNNTAGFGFIFGNNINYVNIEGFEIKDIVEAGININESNSYITVKNNRIHHVGRIQTYTLYGMSCMDVGSRAHHITIEGNIIYSCGRLNPNTIPSVSQSTCTTPADYIFPGNNVRYPNENSCYNHDHGIYVRGDDINITSNTFYDMKSGWGVHVYDDAALKERINITGNTFADANPQRNGQIIVGAQTSNLRIESNIFYNPTAGAVRLGDTCATAGLTNVTIQNNSTNIGYLISGADTSCGYTISGNLLNQNFQFANEAGRDYRLVSGQPIINKPGDFNRDGAVNALDFSLLSGAWNQNNSTYDLNTDGIVNSLDYVIMVQNWTG